MVTTDHLCRSCGEPATATQFDPLSVDGQTIMAILWHPTNLSDCCGEPLLTFADYADHLDAKAEADYYERCNDFSAHTSSERHLAAWQEHQQVHRR